VKHERRILHGEPIDTPAGAVRIVSRVDAYGFGRIAALRHRPVAVEVTRDGATLRHSIRDPGLAAAVSYALLVMTTFRRRR